MTMTNTLRAMTMLAAMLGTTVAPALSRADDDSDSEAAPKDDPRSPAAELFKENGLATLPYQFRSTTAYTEGEVAVTARVSVVDEAECKAAPTTYTITIDSSGGAARTRKVAIGAVGKLTAKVGGTILVTIDVDVTPGCDVMLETVGRYAPT